MESNIELETGFSTLMDASNDAFSLVELDTGNIAAINNAHSRIFGYSLKELNLCGLGKFYGSSDSSHILDNFRKAPGYKIFNCNVTDSSGNSVNVDVSCTQICLLDRDYLLLVNKPVSREENPFISSGLISVEQAFQDSEAKWQSITQNSPDHIMLVDIDGTILYINHTVAGLSVEQVTGKSVYSFTPPEHLSMLKKNYLQVIESGNPAQFEMDYRADGNTIWLDIRVGPVLRDGRVVALLVASRDITDRILILQNLEKSQEHLQHALEAGKTGTWEWDITTNEITWSDGVEAMFGMESGSFKGNYDAFRNLVHPEDLSTIEAAIEQAVENKAPYYVEYRCVVSDGTTRWLNSQGTVYRDAGGRPLRMVGTVTDISQRKIDENRLQQTDFLLTKSQEIAQIGSYIWDVKANLFTWSSQMHRIFGISKQDFDGNGAKVVARAIHPDDQQRLIDAQQFILREKKPYPMEYRVLWPDGTIRYVWAEGSLTLDEKGEVATVVGTVQDITERKLAEAALRKSQQKLALHFQHTPLGVIDWNTDFKVTEWNPAAEKIFGYTREEALGRSATGLVIDDSIRIQIQDVMDALVNNTGGVRSTNENITKDGRTIICEWYNTTLENEKGEVIGISSLVEDVTERVMAQRELEMHQQQLEKLVAERTEEIREQAQIIDQIHDSVVSTDLNGVITNWNNGAKKMFGFAADEMLGKNISLVYPEDQRENLLKEIIPQLKEKGELETEVIVQRKSGERFYALLSLSVRYDNQQTPIGLIGYAIDISDWKRAESQILQQQKALEEANKELESFSYSVSHDLRSPLRAIDGFSAAILDDYYGMLGEDGRENFRRIRSNAQKMAALIDDLLELSRVARHKFRKETVSLSLLAQDVVQKYQYVNPERSVEIEIEENLNVDGDPGLLRIALDNLISNAWKYTEKNDSAKIELFQTSANGSKTFCISDNGVGFDMRYADKMFGAFQRLHRSEEFSGNGIGLATVARIINRHGGRIWAEGDLNKGARFFFTLSDT